MRRIMLVLLLCSVLGGCQSAQKTGDQGTTVESTENGVEVKNTESIETGTEESKHANEEYLADSMSIQSKEDEELVIMRVRGEYVVLPGGNREVYLDECAEEIQMGDGEILRIVADVEIYDGGVAGFMGTTFLKKVKSQEKVSYKEAIEEMDFPDTEGATFWWGEGAVKYIDGDHIYLVVIHGLYMEVFMDGQFVMEYEYSDEEGLLTPFFEFLGTNDGNVEYE